MTTIMLIEDDPQIANIMRIKLTNNGFTVRHHADGQSGLNAALAEPPALILLDVMMPVMDGYQVLQALRANPATRDLPVLMLTAKGQERDVLRGFETGATDYIIKPFSPAEVLARVKRALG